MKKINVILMALVAMLLLSCEEKKTPTQTPEVTVVPVHDMPNICEAHGTVGDGSSMNVIEFINDDGCLGVEA